MLPQIAKCKAQVLCKFCCLLRRNIAKTLRIENCCGSGWGIKIASLPALQKNFVIFFSCLPGKFALKNGGDCWWNFSGLHLPRRAPRNKARKVLEKFGENSEQNSGHNSGRNIEKFGKLSFCNFLDPKNRSLSMLFSSKIAALSWCYMDTCLGFSIYGSLRLCTGLARHEANDNLERSFNSFGTVCNGAGPI